MPAGSVRTLGERPIYRPLLFARGPSLSLGLPPSAPLQRALQGAAPGLQPPGRGAGAAAAAALAGPRVRSGLGGGIQLRGAAVLPQPGAAEPRGHW